MAARKSKPKSPDSQAQQDPKAQLDSAALLKAATPLLKMLAADLLARADGSPPITIALKARHEKERAAERTADNYDTWRRDFVEQVAAAWFLSCVFVRTLEDRGLIDRNRLAGPGAEDSQKAFFALAPSLNERDYMLTVFRELQQLPAARELFDARHNPVWLLGPSAQAAKELLGLFRAPQADAPTFRFGNEDSRFLGDLYQDLSENVRKRYALLQTPRFVERFILDRTLEPAIERFGLNDTNLIDPTCGSGHFLLGAFERLLEHRQRREPGLDVRQAALKALDAVAGSDVNPYAVAIAKFRLALAFVERAGYQRLKEAPKLPLHVVVADSLLHNPYARGQQSLGDMMSASVEAWKGAEFKLEDEAGAKEVLYKRYAAVVGNPPYITVKDKVLRDRYRGIYKTAFREYSLAVPFKERFFQLARPRAYIGMITANSFMKREFGSKVIEEYLPTVNLETIVNTSGAYIPGHGTPTVMLFGTAEKPQSESVLTVLASRGEPSTPEDPEQGHVWRSIAEHWNQVGFNNEYITVTRTERSSLGKHPWSLGGGGATELKALLEERCERRLVEVVESIGFSVITGEDNVLMQPREALVRAGLERFMRRNVIGEEIRDWSIADGDWCIWSCTEQGQRLQEKFLQPVLRYLWPWRASLNERKAFGQPIATKGIPWWALREVYSDRMRTPLTITFAFVATHNHFVLDRGGKVFKQSAPIIKLPASATEDDHYALLAYLNSSTACFWMKQVCHNKTNASQKHSTDPARAAYEFAGAAVEQLPIYRSDKGIAAAARRVDEICAQRMAWSSGDLFRASEASLNSGVKFSQFLDTGWRRYDELTAKAVYLQEEIDWWVYEITGLVDKGKANVQFQQEHLAPLGSRPFEADVGYQSGVSDRARQNPESRLADVSAPPHWAARKALLAEEGIATIEAREFKRMWRDTEQNVDQQEFRDELPKEWLRRYLLDQLESAFDEIAPKTGRQVSAKTNQEYLRTIAEVLAVSETAAVDSALQKNSVPFLSMFVFTDTGLEKRHAWEHTWDLQRREDAGESVGKIPVPPEYSQGSRGKSTDYRENHYWTLRGKLDVPKERFISYPGCESDEDHEPVYGWAGWNHLQRAQALAQLYNARREEGWADEKEDVEGEDGKKKEIRAPRLIPMLAGILELLPWLLQWHNEPSDELGGQRAGEQFSLFLESQCAELGFTHEDLRNWRPRAKRGRAKKSEP